MAMKRYTTAQIAQAQGAALEMLEALEVITLTAQTVDWLQANDPKALEQALAAVRAAEGVCTSKSGNSCCDRPAGHDGPHGCRENTVWGARRSSWSGGVVVPAMTVRQPDNRCNYCGGTLRPYGRSDGPALKGECSCWTKK